MPRKPSQKKITKDKLMADLIEIRNSYSSGIIKVITIISDINDLNTIIKYHLNKNEFQEVKKLITTLKRKKKQLETIICGFDF